MIISFQTDDTEKIFNRLHSNRLPENIQRVALRKLLMIDAAVDIKDLLIPPGNRLEKLSGNRKDQYSIRVNDQWRICFLWNHGQATNVEITDYHK